MYYTVKKKKYRCNFIFKTVWDKTWYDVFHEKQVLLVKKITFSDTVDLFLVTQLDDVSTKH